MLKLYGYWRSTAAYRVRIALNFKQRSYENLSVHLVKDGGEQHLPEYRELNPQGLVPLLIDGPLRIGQSMAILEYIEEKYPNPALLPEDIGLKSQIRALAQMIVSDIHPLNNLRVLQYLSGQMSISDESKNQWYHHWIHQGFEAIESLISRNEHPYCFGDSVSLADVCLVPQVYNANRFNVDLTAYPKICAVNDHCLTLTAFRDASPEHQPDADV